MKTFWDIVMLLALPLGLAIMSQCSKGLVSYFKSYRGRNRERALAQAKKDMKEVAPDLCLIAIGGDFGAGSYIYALGGVFLANKFGVLLVSHFVLFVICTTILVFGSSDRVRILYNNMLGMLAVFLTAAVILFTAQ